MGTSTTSLAQPALNLFHTARRIEEETGRLDLDQQPGLLTLSQITNNPNYSSSSSTVFKAGVASPWLSAGAVESAASRSSSST
jgi:hypothetical protein